jgi:hypothetical protein
MLLPMVNVALIYVLIIIKSKGFFFRIQEGYCSGSAEKYVLLFQGI